MPIKAAISSAGGTASPLKPIFQHFTSGPIAGVKGAAFKQACRFRAADQLKHRTTDGNRMLTSRMVDVHYTGSAHG